MSKVLKFIVHFVVICTILSILALALPPFFGVTTEIRDHADQESNLPMGSVTYAIPVKSSEMTVGDRILAQKDDNAWRYDIASIDLASGTGTAVNPDALEESPVNLSIGEYMPKVVVTIPLIGYLMEATQSIEGLIILALAVFFLIILYVIAELWKKDPKEEDLPEDTEPGYVKSKKELKLEEKKKERLLREEEREIKAESKKNKKKPKRTVRTGGFVDEIEEDDPDEEEDERPEKAVQTATSEAHEVLKKEIAAATAEDDYQQPVRKKKQQLDETRKVVTHKKKVQIPDTLEESVKEEIPEKPVKLKRMAIPRMTAAQLADKAKVEGDSPEIVRDDITKVTLLDYSDIFAEEEDEDEEE